MEIAVATSPDKIYDTSIKLLLIYPGIHAKSILSDYLKQTDKDITVYMYENTEHDHDWLLSVIDQCDLIFYNIDEADPALRMLDAYILSKPKSYWLTQAENKFYNLISRKRIYNYDQLLEKIGGLIGT